MDLISILKTTFIFLTSKGGISVNYAQWKIPLSIPFDPMTAKSD